MEKNNVQVFCYLLLPLLTTTFIHSANPHPNRVDQDYPVFIDGNTLAEVHGDISIGVGDVGDRNLCTEVHVHGIVYAADDHNLNSDGCGNYTLALTVTEAEGVNWGRENYQPDIFVQDSFEGGIRYIRKIDFRVNNRQIRDEIGFTASSTIELKRSLGEDLLIRDYDEQKAEKMINNPDWEDEECEAGNDDSYEECATGSNGEQTTSVPIGEEDGEPENWS